MSSTDEKGRVDMIMRIIADIMLVYLAVCFLVSVIRTIGAKREQWHVYNGQGMSFIDAFVRYFIEDITLGQVTI